MPQIPFVGASYRERSSNLDAQACINLFPVVGESGTAKAVSALYGTPGTRPLLTLPTVPVRGMHVPDDGSRAIVAAGGSVYRLGKDLAYTKIGTIDDGTGLVDITDNGTQAVIVTGVAGYLVDISANTVTRIIDDAFYGASSAAILDTFAIFNRPGTNQFYISGSNDMTFDALDFASAESNAEPIVRLIVNHGELLIFKETVTELWRANGNTDFPFGRDTNATIEQGCAAPWSVASMDNTVFWLGKNKDGGGIVWRLNGYTPQRVSTDAIEYAIAKYPTIADARAYAYQQEGHTFYVLTFPSGGATWVYDAATQLWHQRAYLDPDTGTLGRHRSNCHMYYAGLHIVGDFETGDLYALDLDYFQDGTDPMPSIRAAAYISGPDYNWIIHNRLQVDFEPGVGLVDGQGSAPLVLLDWSDDGGKTWSNQHRGSLGKTGEYITRIFWTRLGRARARTYRVTISDPVKRVIMGAALNPEA
ncbi:hypothetical protein ACL58G_07910 [Massilia sp. GER05]|uniref:hypothetical protein n=1 Tax=Massilia sp. GER05 TaxID=3394605 RepID=UPI003F8388DF